MSAVLFEVFPWSPDFATGEPLIDQQHQQLVHLLNQLAGQLVDGASETRLQAVLDQLSDYASYHFGCEEQIWQAHLGEHPQVERYHASHQGFSEQISAARQDPAPLSQRLEKLLGFLVRWLVFHILDSDRQLAIAVRLIRQQMPVPQALEEAHRQVSNALSALIDSILNMYEQLTSRTLELMRERAARLQAEQRVELLTRQLLEQSEARFSTVFDSIPDGVVLAERDSGNILRINQSMQRLTGMTEQQLRGQHFTRLHPRSMQADIREVFARIVKQPPGSILVQSIIRHLGGEEIPVEISGGGLFEEQGKPCAVGVFRDLRDRLQHQRELEFMAFHDPLTGLSNRSGFTRELEAAMQEARNSANGLLALIYLDLDHFKDINDSFGMQTGDDLLKAVALRLRYSLGEDCVVGRLGGDEFVILVSHLSHPQALDKVLQRLDQVFSRPFRIKPHSLSSTLSSGISLYPQAEAVDADTLIRQANQAMYQAKLRGRERHHYFDLADDQQQRLHHQTLENIRKALHSEQFELYYQPKANLRDGRVIGFEALIRWQHPQQGLIGPGAFLPVIETYPLAIELGDWVIDQALRQLQAWAGQGLRLEVSVNIGALQLQDRQFGEKLAAALAQHPQVQPQQLHIEILESSALQDMPTALQSMQEARSLGVGLALDDFGTGYSSLAYLKQLPIQILKIDQSFVRNMHADPNDMAILQGVLGLAETFGLQVIAEGVETIELGELLIELGCSLGQGYGIARPMPASEVADWLQQWRLPERWREARPVGKENLAALLALIEHRHWLEQLQDPDRSPPELDPERCRFGLWLQQQQSRPGHPQPVLLQRIALTHRQLHELAGRRQCQDCAEPQALQQLSEQLTQLTRAIIHPH